MAGKGSRRRPQQITDAEMERRWRMAFGETCFRNVPVVYSSGLNHDEMMVFCMPVDDAKRVKQSIAIKGLAN